jgi:ketosteroid isomerase-like protein
MKDLIPGLSWLFPGFEMVSTGPLTGGGDDEERVAQTLGDYYRAFSKLDMQAILPYFHEPSMLVGPRGFGAAPNHAALATMLAPSLKGLPPRRFARSELIRLHVRRLSAATALASGVAVRYKTDGKELERAGVTYLMQKAKRNWKIAVLVIHEPENALPL